MTVRAELGGSRSRKRVTSVVKRFGRRPWHSWTMSPLSPSLDDTPPPPDSWPGAAGRRSIAPEVPSWPGAPVSRDAPGGGWPGANGGEAGGEAGAGWPATSPAGTRDTRPGKRVPGGVAAILFPALVGVVLLLLLGLWASLDEANRSAQVAVLALVVLGALGALIVSAWRHRG